MSSGLIIDARMLGGLDVWQTASESHWEGVKMVNVRCESGQHVKSRTAQIAEHTRERMSRYDIFTPPRKAAFTVS